MRIPTTKTNIGKNLKPKAEHNGPVLKLTQKDKARIAPLEKSLIAYEREAFSLENLYNANKKNPHYRDYYFQKLLEIETWIERLKNEIRQIKIDRFTKQKEKFNSKNP